MTYGLRSWHRYVSLTTRKWPLDPSTCRAGSKKFFRKLLLKGLPYVPRVIITDKLNRSISSS
jgi:hypothetical protein